VKPIIFNTDMVKAILEGRKTQTRRVIMPQPHIERGVMRWQKSHKGGMHGIDLNMDDHADLAAMFCPYGGVGDKLWVRETIAEWQGTIEAVQNGDMDEAEALEYIIYKAGAKDWAGILKDMSYGHPWNVRPSIFMPCWASRITLEITEIRVERLQEITPMDCIREGVLPEYEPGVEGLRLRFQVLWDSINGKKHPWLSNPWVWVISFKMLKDKDEG